MIKKIIIKIYKIKSYTKLNQNKKGELSKWENSYKNSSPIFQRIR